MIHFFLEARHGESNTVRLAAYRGSYAGRKAPIGEWLMTFEEWQAFRRFVYGGIVATRYLKGVEIEFHDTVTPMQKPDRSPKLRTEDHFKSVH